MRRLAVLAAALLALLACAGPAAGAPGRVTVGLAAGVSAGDVAGALEAATGGTVTSDLGPLDAVVLTVPDVDAAIAAVSALPGVEYVEPTALRRRLLFDPNDPLYREQWYLPAIRAFEHWDVPPPQPPVLVAVIDSGIDGTHPELIGRIAAARSFVRSPANVDSAGHGTIVAGAIAATLDNAQGIAGVGGIPARLLVAKVVNQRGEISVYAEAQAIRWAVNNGARVINLSLGGPRDPHDPFRDSYSELERSAIDYATRNGVVVVAAVGNCLPWDVCPDPYANYPAALPHVLGVSALDRSMRTPVWSNRDAVFNDVAAPGVDILSTYPTLLPHAPGCDAPGYTRCATDEADAEPSGTSFSAPLVAAAAAVLRSETGLPGMQALHASQVTHLIERAATDVGRRGRDRWSGFGLLDVDRTLDRLSGPLPPRDRYETNDDAGARAWTLRGRRRTVYATLTRFDDVRDVYRVYLAAGRRAAFSLAGPAGGESSLTLWRPGTRRVTGPGRRLSNRVTYSASPGWRERISVRATQGGWYYLELRLTGGRSGAYRLGIVKR